MSDNKLKIIRKWNVKGKDKNKCAREIKMHENKIKNEMQGASNKMPVNPFIGHPP